MEKNGDRAGGNAKEHNPGESPWIAQTRSQTARDSHLAVRRVTHEESR